MPRLYVDFPLAPGASVALEENAAHYLRTVLRRPDGSNIRLFNGRDGEWRAALHFDGKKAVRVSLDTQILPQPPAPVALHLAFCLIKKGRMDFLIEKAVELGATDLHPVLGGRSIVRDINETRMNAQIREAAEQSERLDLPRLYPLLPLEKFCAGWVQQIPLFAALERGDYPALTSEVSGEKGFLIGPEGGFTDEERGFLTAQGFVRPVSLGPRILRAETAALYGLSRLGADP